MISPELLHRYSFFNGLTNDEYKTVAMLAEVQSLPEGTILFEEGQSADKFYILTQGNIDLFMKAEEPNQPKSRKDFFVGEINTGDIFGISAMLEPFIYTATAKSAESVSFIEFNALMIRELMGQNCLFALNMTTQIARALYSRLNSSRIQLAAAWQ